MQNRERTGGNIRKTRQKKAEEVNQADAGASL